MKLKTPAQVTIDTAQLSAIIPETERGHTRPFKVYAVVDGVKILVARFENPKEAVQYMDELTRLWIDDQAGTNEGSAAKG